MTVVDRAEELLGGEVDLVLGYRSVEGASLPCLFDGENLEDLCCEYPPDERYPLALVLRRIQGMDPGIRTGVVVRGCDERALIELAKQGQVDLDRVAMIGLACDESLAISCGCDRPYPSVIDQGERVQPSPDRQMMEKLEEMPAEDRLSFWLGQFAACIKCFGCRNICPLCYCEQCALDSEDLVPHGKTPPAEPIFHLIRAMDMAGRCIDCGLCEEACPMGIPLRTLYRKVADVVEGEFGYRPGVSLEEESPLAVLGEASDIED